MTNIFNERKEKIGRRIAEERKKLRGIDGKICTQEVLAQKINDILGAETVSQGAISQWEKGKIPPLDRLLVLSKIFNCDCAYLLCDYDEKTHDSASISNSTGLSVESVDYLCSMQQWGGSLESKMIDFLLSDAKEREPTHNYRSILDLLSFYFRYRDRANSQKQIYVDGRIYDADTDGYISTGAIRLNERIIENAVLNEITRALISLKSTLQKEGERHNG